MQGRQRFVPAVGEQREVQIVGVKMDEVELAYAAPYPVQHGEMIGKRILALRIEAQSLLARRVEHRRGLGIAARKQRHVMPQAEQLLGKVEYDALRTPIVLRRA